MKAKLVSLMCLLLLAGTVFALTMEQKIRYSGEYEILSKSDSIYTSMTLNPDGSCVLKNKIKKAARLFT